MGAFVYYFQVDPATTGVEHCVRKFMHPIFFFGYLLGIRIIFIDYSCPETKVSEAYWKNLPSNQCGYPKGSKHGNLAIF